MESWYDKEEDILNIQLKDEEYWKSIELPNSIVIDISKTGKVMAIEILRASMVFSGDTKKVIKMAKLGVIQRVINRISQDGGRVLETTYAAGARAYMEVKRTGKGSDYMVRYINPLTGKGKGSWISIEIKSGRATTTNLQKAFQKKLGKRYKVLRWIS